MRDQKCFILRPNFWAVLRWQHFLGTLRFCVAFQLSKDQNFGMGITWCVLVGFGLFQSVERRECCVVYEQVFLLSYKRTETDSFLSFCSSTWTPVPPQGGDVKYDPDKIRFLTIIESYFRRKNMFSTHL